MPLIFLHDLYRQLITFRSYTCFSVCYYLISFWDCGDYFVTKLCCRCCAWVFAFMEGLGEIKNYTVISAIFYSLMHFLVVNLMLGIFDKFV